MMRVLIACEFSGIVRTAFAAAGHYAVSCDLEPSELPGHHIQGDVRRLLHGNYDMMIAFPPCTFICRSGSRYHSETDRMYDALSFVGHLMAAPIPRIAIENPVGHISTHFRPPDQIIQPHQFGHAETKATCLWLKGLPKLTPTDKVPPPWARNVLNETDHGARALNRSRTYTGIAAAMADQWGRVTV